VDPFTSYRYYSADQLPQLNRILALRDLGFSLEQIRHWLDSELSAAELRGMLKLRRAEISQRLHEEQERLARVEAHLALLTQEAGEPTQAHQVVVRSVESQWVAGLRRTVYAESAGDESDGVALLFDEVERFAARHKARAPLPPLMIYQDAESQEDESEVEAAVPLQFAIPAQGAIAVYELPGHETMACLIHTGGYDGMAQTFADLLRWMELHRYTIAGPIRSVFLRFGADCEGYVLPAAYLTENAADLVTELQIPVARQEAR
jgi:DNA-binding transcriptional MerR regulator